MGKQDWRPSSSKRRKLDKEYLDSLLRISVRNGTSLADIAQLISRGASVNGRDTLGYTPLLLAIEHVRISTDVIKLLCSHGADVNQQDDVFYGQTPLHFAAARDKYDVIKILVQYGADLNARTFSGWTPLHIAASHGYEASTTVLCNLGANVDAKENYCGYTPLHVSMAGNHDNSVDILVRFGSSLSEKDYYGMSASKRCECVEMVEKFNEIARKPRCLEYLCLRSVRANILPPKLKSKFKKLPLPKTMKTKIFTMEAKIA